MKYKHITIKQLDTKISPSTKFYIVEENIYLNGWEKVLNWIADNGEPSYDKLVIGYDF